MSDKGAEPVHPVRQPWFVREPWACESLAHARSRVFALLSSLEWRIGSFLLRMVGQARLNYKFNYSYSGQSADQRGCWIPCYAPLRIEDEEVLAEIARAAVLRDEAKELRSLREKIVFSREMWLGRLVTTLVRRPWTLPQTLTRRKHFDPSGLPVPNINLPAARDRVREREQSRLGVCGSRAFERLFREEGLAEVETLARRGDDYDSLVEWPLDSPSGQEKAKAFLNESEGCSSESNRVVVWVTGECDDLEALSSLRELRVCAVVVDRLPNLDFLRSSGLKPHFLGPCVQPTFHNPIVESKETAVNQLWNEFAKLVSESPPDAERSALNASTGEEVPGLNLKHNLPAELARVADSLIRLRWLYSRHSVASRLIRLGEYLGYSERKGLLASWVVCSMRPQNFDHVLDGFKSQSYPHKELILVCHGWEPNTTQQSMLDKLNSKWLSLPSDWTLGRCTQKGTESSSGDIVFKVDDDEYYGPHYTEDQLMALRYSGAGIVCKKEHAIVFEGGPTILRNVGLHHRFVFGAPGGSMAIRREVFDEVAWDDVPRAVDGCFVRAAGQMSIPIFSSDPFNYVMSRRRSTSKHTWQIRQEDLVRRKGTKILAGADFWDFLL